LGWTETGSTGIILGVTVSETPAGCLVIMGLLIMMAVWPVHVCRG